VHRQPHLWAHLRANGMAEDHSWEKSAGGYDHVYAEAMDRVRRGIRPTLESMKAEREPSRERTALP